jgi:hypothetical protein
MFLTQKRRFIMKSRHCCLLFISALLLFSGCARTTVTNQQQMVSERIPCPQQILVYDFVTTPDTVPGDSRLSGQYSDPQTPPTYEQIETGRKVADEIASALVTDLQEMGMPAVRALTSSTPQINDVVIRGYIVSIVEGSEGKRLVIGFGSGSSELKTVVEGFQMTPQGLREIGSGTLDSGGSKGPGAALGLATLLATGNPAGLIVSSGLKIYGEASGKSKIEGRSEQTAKEIADAIQKRMQENGCI